MKTVKMFLLIAVAAMTTSFARAQQFNYKSDGPFTISKTFKVRGNCEMCKNRIEKSVNGLPGVWYSYWDVSSKTLLVNYDKTRINPGMIEKLVSTNGHDINSVEATAEVYNKLPECCRYQRKS